MKPIIILSAFITLFLFACRSKDKEVQTTPPAVSEHYTWVASMDDSTGNLKMVQANPIPDDSLNKEFIIALLNNRFNIEKQQLLSFDFVKQAGDTIWINIPDATYLTQQSGSTGAYEHLGTIVYNLTEIPGIKWVKLDFDEGDHAAPGVYGRDSAGTGITIVSNRDK